MRLRFYAILFLLTSCSQPKDALEKIARSRIETMSQHDLDALGKLFADSARIESVGFDKPEIGPSGIRGAYTRYFASTPDLKYEITKITLDENSAVIEYTSSGTMTQSGLEATIPDYFVGKKYTLKNATRIDVEQGKIIREMSYFDQVSFLRQMGFFDPR